MKNTYLNIDTKAHLQRTNANNYIYNENSFTKDECDNRYIFKSLFTVCFVRNEKLAAGFEENVEMCCCWFHDSNRTVRRVLAAGHLKMLL